MRALCRTCDIRPATYQATVLSGPAPQTWFCCAACAVNALQTHMAERIRPVVQPGEDS